MAAPIPVGLNVPQTHSGQAMPTHIASERPAVKVTEADRVAWMQQFMSALDQWKTFLDDAFEGGFFSTAAAIGPADAVPESAAAPMQPPAAGASVPGGCPGFMLVPTADIPPPPNNGHMENMAALAAAQQSQYIQQVQFFQQMQVHEANQQGGIPPAPSSSPVGCGGSLETPRFKEHFRPMRFCKHLFTLGFCKQAGQCTFAHNATELHPSSPDVGKSPMSATSSLAEQGPSTGSDATPDLRLKKKKELCERFSKGYCMLGKVCSFAHGEDQLNTIGLAVCGKVKTQLCRNFAAGRCIYGKLCNNAHGEQEIGTKRPPPEMAPPVKRRAHEEGE